MAASSTGFPKHMEPGKSQTSLVSSTRQHAQFAYCNVRNEVLAFPKQNTLLFQHSIFPSLCINKSKIHSARNCG